MSERNKGRIKLTTEFFLDIHDIVTRSGTYIDTELDSITNTVLFNP